MPMVSSRRNFYVFIGILALALAVLPYLFAYSAAGDGQVFAGILINPLDGNSYLAKAYQGYLGDWKSHLPYSASPDKGAYFHIVYILIGHFARLTGLSIPFLFHFFRVLGAAALLFSLYRYFSRVLESDFERRTAFALSVLGLGMGWLAVPFGIVTADFWVAEGYPLLASLATPHFAFGLALIVWLATPVQAAGWKHLMMSAGLTILLGLVSPFGIAVAALPWIGLVVMDLYSWNREKRGSLLTVLNGTAFRKAAAIALGGLPIVLYVFFAIRNDPVLSGWDRQNLTPSPAWWDLLLSLSPAIFLGILGLRKVNPGLVSWVFLSMLLLILPFNLQRRFMMGLYIPIAGLGASGIAAISGTGSRRRMLTTLLFVLVLPGTALMVASLVFGALSGDPALFLSDSEEAAFEWIADELPPDSLILAGPDTGLFIPAHTGQRVIYGHPFETVDAEAEKALVLDFYRENDPDRMREILTSREVDYIFYGPREEALGPLFDAGEIGVTAVYDEPGVRIYKVQP